MHIDREEINKKLEDKGYYYKSFKVWDKESYNDILTECLIIKDEYNDYDIKLLQVEGYDKRPVSINLEISKEV